MNINILPTFIDAELFNNFQNIEFINFFLENAKEFFYNNLNMISSIVKSNSKVKTLEIKINIETTKKEIIFGDEDFCELKKKYLKIWSFAYFRFWYECAKITMHLYLFMVNTKKCYIL